jgi:hypothetical protein
MPPLSSSSSSSSSPFFLLVIINVVIFMIIVANNNDNYVSSSFVTSPSLSSFQLTSAASSSSTPLKHHYSSRSSINNEGNDEDVVFNQLEIETSHHHSSQVLSTRRRLLLAAAASSTTIVIANSSPLFTPVANAAGLGTLPEFANTHAILQSITIDCENIVQYEDTLNFFIYSFDMKILRQRSSIPSGATTTTKTKERHKGDTTTNKAGNDIPMKETWLGYGPEELSIPSNFIFPISSFANYGGHSSLHIRYIPSTLSSSSSTSYDSASVTPTTTPISSSSSSSTTSSSMLYTRTPNSEYNNEPAPGNNIAYIQLGVPTYRISQMVRYGGNVIDAYGYVNVICPAGVPIRAIVGIKSIDPIMFIAINCVNITQSTEFYTSNKQLGFSISNEDYPYARPNFGQGQFEPPQPKGSVYLSPCKSTTSTSCTYYGMGILLLPKEEKKTKSLFGVAYGKSLSFTDNNVNLIPNPVVKSLNIVYAASTEMEDSSSSSSSSSSNMSPITDPSFVPLTFISQDVFTREIKMMTTTNN